MSIHSHPDDVAETPARSLEEEIADSNQSIALNPDDARAYINRGYTKSELGRYEEAIADFDQSFALYPDNAIAYINRGYAKSELGRHEEAIADYDQSIALNPENALAHNNRNHSMSQLGRRDTPFQYYSRRVRLNPDDAGARGELGNSKYKQGRFEAAIVDFSQAIELSPVGTFWHTHGYIMRGSVKYKLERYGDAIAECDEVIRFDPNYFRAYSYRGHAKYRLGRFEEALRDFDQAIRLDSDELYLDPYRLVTTADNFEGYSPAEWRVNSLKILGRFQEAFREGESLYRRLALRSLEYARGSSPAVVERPNQEALISALNIYRDAMRTFLLTSLADLVGSGALKDTIVGSLGDEQSANFERTLSRNDGNIEATLDVNHFLPIVRRFWDDTFFAKLGYDQSMLGTLGWITNARNEASHPGTDDISPEDTMSGLSNIRKTLDRIQASEQGKAVDGIRERLRSSSSGTPQIQLQEDIDRIFSTQSICTYKPCSNINSHLINEDGTRRLPCCPECSNEYWVETGSVVSVNTNRISIGNNWAIQYILRIQNPAGKQWVLYINRPTEDLILQRNDEVSLSYEYSRNNDQVEPVHLMNLTIGHRYYIQGGLRRHTPTELGGPGKGTGCLSIVALPAIIATILLISLLLAIL